MISLFVTPQIIDIKEESIQLKEWRKLFRKLSLYPTELRGPSAPFIFDLDLRCTNFCAIVHSIYASFTRFHKRRPEKDRKSQAFFHHITTQKFTTRTQLGSGDFQMAKRFTDTAKWDKAWYRKLGSKLRDIRQFCLDKCDHAGLLEIDFETFKHFIGEDVSTEEIGQAFRGKMRVVDDKFFFPDFIEFQYKCSFNELNPANKVHSSVLRRLKELDILSPLQAPCIGAKDKDKEQDKDKDRTFLDADAFRASLPIYVIDRGVKDFGAARFNELVAECFHFHNLDKSKIPKTEGDWAKKLFTWFQNEKKNPKKPSDNEPLKVLPSV